MSIAPLAGEQALDGGDVVFPVRERAGTGLLALSRRDVAVGTSVHGAVEVYPAISDQLLPFRPADRRTEGRPRGRDFAAASGAKATGASASVRTSSADGLDALALHMTGAVIGIAATLIADRNRWRREVTRHALEVRREVYTEYVSALKAAGEEIRAVALGDHNSGAARDAAVREAVRSTGVYTASERLWLVGPPQVVERGNEAFHCMRALRDAYARGVAVGSAGDAPLIERRRKAMAQMRRAMREDLGIGPLGIE